MTSVAEASFNGGIGSSTVTANSIAVGDDAKTTAEYTIALGSRSKAKNIYAIAMGDLAEATGQGATAIGSQSKSTALHSLAVGDQAQAMAVNSSAYGILSKALSSHSVAIGNEASVGKGDPDSVSSQNGIAIGNGANVTVNPATATPGITDKSGGIAIGHDATTKDINTIALGTGTIGQGAQAVAIGRNARTIANNGVAIGNEARTQSTNGFALGNNARAGFDENNVLVGRDNDQAFGSNARAWGGSSMAFGNNAKAANGGAIAMGNGSQSRGDWGVAIGNGAKALATGARALGANSKASGVNAAAIGWDSEASGASSIAVGEMVKSTGTNSVAIGTGAKATNENAVALGAGSETALTVVTSSATINGTVHNFAGVNPASTVSVGKAGSERTITNVAAGRISVASTDAINGSQLYAVTSEIDKGVAYAGDVKAAAAATNKFTRKLGEQTNIVGGVADASKLTDGNIGVVSDGTDTLNIKMAKNVKVDSVTTGNTVINNNGLTVGGKNYVMNSGINANNQTVTNVASGGNTTTNAANIGDVQTAVNNAVTNVTNTLTAKGLDFEGNDGAANKVHRDLGAKLTVKGGLADVTNGVSGKNLGVKKNVAGDGLDLVMSENPEFKEVTAGTGTNKVVINDNGVHVSGKTYINNSGLNANNQKITNVATGTAGTDAVNVDQLNAAIGGTAKATIVKAKDANVTVTKGTSAETGGREYTVGLRNVVTVGQTHPVTVNGDAGTVNGLINTTWDIDNPQPVSGQSATEDQLKTVSDGVKTNKTNITKNANDITNINTTIGKGVNFKGDDATVINKKLGEQLDIKGGADASKLSDGNIGVVSGNGALNIKLAKNVKVDSVTTGNTVINDNGLTVGGKNYVTNNGINANNQKVTNVADGHVAAGSKDAVNGGQLHDAKNEVINKGLRFDADNNSEKTNKLGSKVTVNGDNNITTEITQTGDDTKIGVKLDEDIYVKTVTATDTVKAGGVTMGSQTSGGTTGNYVTGLDNKT